MQQNFTGSVIPKDTVLSLARAYCMCCDLKLPTQLLLALQWPLQGATFR